jgi:ATP-dependent Clp protease adaptor protein ClpS
MASYKYELEDDTELEAPKKYKVLLLNDDFSTMDLVIKILTVIFRKTYEEADAIMLNIHNNGKVICGIYTKEIALTKVSQVQTMSRKENFPLKAIAEEE